ncbi:MAG: tRNA-ribosyltransferase [Thermoproteus sp.]|nr:tRNA-ribosyltransferase [Thermoproteus sp.]
MRVVLGTPVRTEPKPWLHFDVAAVMVNALDADKRARELLGFEGELWVDSGGYQILKRGLSISPHALARRYRDIGCDVCLSLDIPPSPADPPDVADRKAEASYRNWLVLKSELPDAKIVPVVHVYPDEGLFLKWIKRYEDAEEVAIGGAVPYILISRGVPRGSRSTALRLIATARREFGGKLHALGLGSPSVSAILEALRVDSTDSATWRLKAAYGKVLLPGGGERHVTDRQINFGKKKAEDGELAELYMFLKATGFPALDGFDDYVARLKTSFEYRALVNAWIVLRSREPPRSAVFRKLYQEALSLLRVDTPLQETQ